MAKTFAIGLRTALGAALGVCIVMTTATAQDAYRSYRNERFGVRADIPRDWRAGQPPENGDGLKFTSPDGAATITVSGMLNNDTVAEAMQGEQAPDDGEIVTYHTVSGRVSVVSGTRGGTIFYRKAVLSCGDQVMNRLSIEYPQARKKAFDALVTHVAGSLRGGSGWQAEKCN